MTPLSLPRRGSFIGARASQGIACAVGALLAQRVELFHYKVAVKRQRAVILLICFLPSTLLKQTAAPDNIRIPVAGSSGILIEFEQSEIGQFIRRRRLQLTVSEHRFNGHNVLTETRRRQRGKCWVEI